MSDNVELAQVNVKRNATVAIRIIINSNNRATYC